MTTTVIDNPDEQRFEIQVDGELAALTEYRLHGSVADFPHTETLEGFQGRGLARELVVGALAVARERGWQVRPFCPYVRKVIAEDPALHDLVPADQRERFDLPPAADDGADA